MELTTDRRDAMVVVTVDGEIDASNVAELQACLDDLLVQGDHNFVIDLAEVAFMDSSGLATLVHLFKRVRLGEGDVRLCGLQPQVRRVFELVRLNRVFETFPSRELAVASFPLLSTPAS